MAIREARWRAHAWCVSGGNAGKEVALLVDLQGPKIRVETFQDEFVELEPGQRFSLDAGPSPAVGDRHQVGVTYKGLAQDVKVDDELLLDDGLITCVFGKSSGRMVRCEVEVGGRLSSRKGINLKGGGLSIPGIAERDREDIHACGRDGCRLPGCLISRAMLMTWSKPAPCCVLPAARPGLVAKIERTEAIENLDEIIEASHAVLVARGDLGVEIGDAELPGLQKLIIRKALEHNRIVITATQMMQSMVENPIPTRAEVLDVANAVIDGTDAVMLSAETAVGKHPVKVIEAMHRVCLGAERHVESLDISRRLNVHFQRIDQAIASAAMFLASHVRVDAIIALTESGSTAQWLSRVRSSVPIYALSPLAASRRRMALYRDVYPIAHVAQANKMDKVLRSVVELLMEQGRIREGDRVILTMGDSLGNEGGTNTMRLVQVSGEGFVESQTRLDLR